MKRLYTEQIQRMICLLFVLEEMPGRPARKQDVIKYICRQGYMKFSPEDWESYKTQSEPRWNTDIAFRRKDGVEWGLLFNNQHDSWELTREGIELLEKIKIACAAQKYDVRECYLWAKPLKKALDGNYKPSLADKSRPQKIKLSELLKDLKP